MPIIKTLSKATKAERDKFRIPRSVQDAIPIRRIWSDGVFQVGTQFSKTFSFTDINCITLRQYNSAERNNKPKMIPPMPQCFFIKTAPLKSIGKCFFSWVIPVCLLDIFDEIL